MAGLERVFPWGWVAAVRSVAVAMASGVGLIGVWFGVSGRGVLDRQVGWLGAGVIVIVVELYALATLVVRGRRAVGARRARLISDAVAELPRLAAAAGVEGVIGEVVVVPSMDMFHRQFCPMRAGRNVEHLTEAEAARRGLVPCGVCAGWDDGAR